MRRWKLSRGTLSLSATAVLLTACGGSQLPIGARGAMQESAWTAARESGPLARTWPLLIVPASSYRVLYRFRSRSNGAQPWADLIEVKGVLYGTTYTGGGSGSARGTVFSVTTSGKERVLHTFGAKGDGAKPQAGLINLNGMLYGTTDAGGAHHAGAVFRVTMTGKEKVLYSFGAHSDDGAGPGAGLIDVDGTLYGTTAAGGSGSGCISGGCGTVFSVTTSGKEKVLHNFHGGSDGAVPLFGSLIKLNGRLYGTTVIGGPYGAGTVFSVTTTGDEKVLYSFRGSDDGEQPYAGLVNVNGMLYGVTLEGGKYASGTVFRVTTTGKEKVLYSFGRGSDGANPRASLINLKTTLYGTTQNGGKDNYGTVFSITAGGAKNTLHSFTGGSDGEHPYSSLLNVKGTLYGTTSGGGGGCTPLGCGAVFAVTP